MRFDKGRIGRYLYLQILDPTKIHTAIGHKGYNGHPLAQHQRLEVKGKFKTQLGAAEYVKHQYNIAIGGDILYLAKDLQDIPHGDDLLLCKLASDNALMSQYNVGITDIPITHTMSEYDGIMVYRPGSTIIDGLSNQHLGLDFQQNIFQYTVNHARLTNSKTDIRDFGSGIRLDLGFTQGQLCSDLFMGDKDFKIPNTKDVGNAYLHSMPLGLRNDLGRMLRYCQDTLKSKFPNAMSDEYRSCLARPYFMDKFFPGMEIDFEYFNISVRKSTDVLLKHMDYLNDWRMGYNHAAVYSYFILDKGVKYRVTIVMCFRRSIGSFVEHMMQVEG